MEGMQIRGGVIDADYTGNVTSLVQNTSDKELNCAMGRKIAQMVIVTISMVEVEKVTEIDTVTERGEGGFGSIGTQGDTMQQEKATKKQHFAVAKKITKKDTLRRKGKIGKSYKI